MCGPDSREPLFRRGQPGDDNRPGWEQAPELPHLPAVNNQVFMRCANGIGSDIPGQLFVAIGHPPLPCWPDLLQPLAPHPRLLVPPVTLRTVQDLKTFFERHPGHAQRSVAYGMADRYTYQARYEQRDSSAAMQLELRAHACPPAWTFSVLGNDANGPLQIAPFVLGRANGWVSSLATVPAGYEDTLTLHIDTHGHMPGEDARVDLVLSVQLPVQGLSGREQPTLFRLGCHSWRAQPPAMDTAWPARGVASDLV